MSTTPESPARHSAEQNQPAYGAPAFQPAYGAAPAAPPAGRSGLAIAGFVLAFFIAPLGFILSLVGLIQASRRRQRGKVLASLGLVVSVLVMGVAGAVFFTVGSKAATVVDPGCVKGKEAVLSFDPNGPDPTGQIRTIVTGLNSAAAQAKHDNVRAALKRLADDYNQLLQAIATSTPPSAELEGKLDADAAAFDSLCTVGAK